MFAAIIFRKFLFELFVNIGLQKLCGDQDFNSDKLLRISVSTGAGNITYDHTQIATKIPESRQPIPEIEGFITAIP